MNHGGNDVKVGVEIAESNFFKDGRNEIVIHFPENQDVTNWYHAVCIKRDLKD